MNGPISLPRIYDNIVLASRLAPAPFSYCADVPRPPKRHEEQIPKPLPLAWIKPQSEVIRASSAALRVAGVNAVSVTANPPAFA